MTVFVVLPGTYAAVVHAMVLGLRSAPNVAVVASELVAVVAGTFASGAADSAGPSADMEHIAEHNRNASAGVVVLAGVDDLEERDSSLFCEYAFQLLIQVLNLIEKQQDAAGTCVVALEARPTEIDHAGAADIASDAGMVDSEHRALVELCLLCPLPL